MKKTIVSSVALIVAALGLAALPAGAAERTPKPAASVLPAHEILTIVRSAGLNPVSKPARKGANYLLRAVDDEGTQVHVIVDGRLGEVIAVTPVGVNAREIDPMRPSVFDAGRPQYEFGLPTDRTAPIIIEEEREAPIYRRAAPAVPPSVVPPPVEREVVIVPPAAAPPWSQPPSVTAPPQREREVVVAPPPETMAAPPEPGDELLPPPPPRFQQRVNATPNSKPTPNTAIKSAKTAAKPSAKTDSVKVESANPSAPASAAPESPANGKLSPLY